MEMIQDRFTMANSNKRALTKVPKSGEMTPFLELGHDKTFDLGSSFYLIFIALADYHLIQMTCAGSAQPEGRRVMVPPFVC